MSVRQVLEAAALDLTGAKGMGSGLVEVHLIALPPTQPTP